MNSFSKKVSCLQYPAKLPTLEPRIEQQLVKGDPMTVYPDLIRACAHYYISQGIEINKMQDYEVVCRSILEKYTKLGRSVYNFCKIQNASPTIKAVKRLNPHVNMTTWINNCDLHYIYFFILIKRFVSHSLSKCIRNKRHNMKRYGGPVITSGNVRIYSIVPLYSMNSVEIFFFN